MSERLKRQLALMTMVFLALQLSVVKIGTAFAAAPRVVINEVAWAGTADNTNDEWIELYNPTADAVDLTNWYIKDDDETTYLIESGEIAAFSYFLIEDKEEALDVKADAVIGLSLANSGDSLALYDDQDQLIDIVNGADEAWYAGGEEKASMERIDPAAGDLAENWAAAKSGNAAKGRDGTAILGTPGSMNSVFDGEGLEVSLEVAEDGEDLVVAVMVEDAVDLYAYGFDLVYEGLEFVNAEESDLLGAEAAFEAALEDGKEGVLVVGAARLVQPADGVDGDGELLKVRFRMIDEEMSVNFAAKSYVADSKGKVPVKFKGWNVGGGAGGAGDLAAVKDLKVEEAEARYALKLSWEAVDGAERYVVQRVLPNGEFVTVGVVENAEFVDGNQLLVNVDYAYRVYAERDGKWSAAVEVNGREERGLEGDMDRSDRVDGGDIEALARSYGLEYGEEGYEVLKDADFDGVIDGSDLISIGVNFGRTY